MKVYTFKEFSDISLKLHLLKTNIVSISIRFCFNLVKDSCNCLDITKIWDYFTESDPKAFNIVFWAHINVSFTQSINLSYVFYPSLGYQITMFI